MFALLGPVFFETLTSPEGFQLTDPYTYAEHHIVEAPPRLQWIANDLHTITLDMGFHITFTNPATQWNLLVELAEAHNANLLVFGNGMVEGYFVIEQLQRTLVSCADDGSFIAITAQAILKQWILGEDFDPTRPIGTPPGITHNVPTLQPLSGPVVSQVIPTLQFLTNTPGPLIIPPDSNPPPLIFPSITSSLGVPAGTSYDSTPFSSPGVSALSGAGPGPFEPGTFTAVSTATIVRAG